MPDRDDPFGYPDAGVIPGAPAVHDVPYQESPDPAPLVDAGPVKHDQVHDIRPGDWHEWMQDRSPRNVFDERPDEYYTQYDVKVRAELFPFPVLLTSQGGQIIQPGSQHFGGYSIDVAGATAPMYLRDGNDLSGRIILVIPPTGGTLWIGANGLNFQYGVYFDANTGAGNNTALTRLQGSVFLERHISQ